MTLDSKLKELLEKGNGKILVVDDGVSHKETRIKAKFLGDPQGLETFGRLSFMMHEIRKYMKENGVCLDIYGSSYDDLTGDLTGDFIKGLLEENSDNLLILASGVDYYGCISVVQAINGIGALKSASPEASLFFYIPGGDMQKRAVERCTRQVLRTTCPDAIDSIEAIDREKFPTLMHLLVHTLRGRNGSSGRAEAHRYKSEMWKKKYLPFIDSSLRAGNTQSEKDYHFIILSDNERIKLGDEEIDADEKVRVWPSLDYLNKDGVKLEKCAAVFIDNAWNHLIHKGALGHGINALRKMRALLDEKGINMPIIYQSGHNLDEFTEEERDEIESLGAVLASKDVFPKVCRSELSEKEIEMGRVLRKYSKLAKYSATVHDFGKSHALGRGNLFVVCSRIVDGDEAAEDNEKSELFGKLGLKNNFVNHRMYVLSLFHSELKGEVGNDKLQATSKDFYSIDEVIAKAPDYASQLEPLRQPYERITAKHMKVAPRVLTHNDAKDDNWFNGRVLGDFGSVQPGTEYKDIAKALMHHALDRELVDRAIDAYIAIRKEQDQDFDAGDDFRENVYEMIVTESIRTVYYKPDNKELADILIKTARMYKGILEREGRV